MPDENLASQELVFCQKDNKIKGIEHDWLALSVTNKKRAKIRWKCKENPPE